MNRGFSTLLALGLTLFPLIPAHAADSAAEVGSTRQALVQKSAAASVEYDEVDEAALISTKPYIYIRIGASSLYLRLPAGYEARESGGYAIPGTGLRFDIFHVRGFPDVRSVLVPDAGGAEITERTVNGIAAAFRSTTDELAVALDAGGGKYEKLVFHLTDETEKDDMEARRMIRSLREMRVVRLGNSPLTVAAPAAFVEAPPTDTAGGPSATYADAAEQRYFDLYLHSYDGSFDTFAVRRAAVYGDRAGGIVTYTLLVKYFSVSGGHMTALIDLGGGSAAELRFRSDSGEMDWALEIVRSLRAG